MDRRLCCLQGQIAAHERQQLAFVLVKNEQFFGQQRLVVKHIDQKAERTQIVAQLLKGTRFAGQVFIHLGVQHLINDGAHPNNGLHGLVKSQHREHTTHLRQLRHRDVQTTLFTGCTKKLVQRFFGLTERYLEFTHHTAHRLAITDSPVQLLHPGIQRLGRSTGTHAIQPLGQRLRALGHFSVTRVKIFERRLQVQGGRGDLHGELWAHASGIMGSLVGGLQQGLSQSRTGWVKLQQ